MDPPVYDTLILSDVHLGSDTSRAREATCVLKQNRFRRLRPEIMVILDADKKVREEFATINLLTCAQNSASKEPTLWITTGLEAGAYGIDPTEYFL